MADPEARYNVYMKVKITEIGNEGRPVFYDGENFWGDMSLGGVVAMEAAVLDLFKGMGAAGLELTESKKGDIKVK